MNAKKDWESTQAFNGSTEKLEAGAYICKIIGVRIENNDYGERIVLQLDIEEGALKGFAKRKYERNKTQNPNAKWPIIATQKTEDAQGNTNAFFKGLIKSIEESNSGYVWDWDESKLKGKIAGYIFREEEFIAADGKLRIAVKPFQARSVVAIKEGVTIPAIKRLQSTNTVCVGTTNGFTAVADDDELPF